MKMHHALAVPVLAMVATLLAACAMGTDEAPPDQANEAATQENVDEAASAISTCSVECTQCPPVTCSGTVCSADQNTGTVQCDGVSYSCPVAAEERWAFAGCNVQQCLGSKKAKYVKQRRTCGGDWTTIPTIFKCESCPSPADLDT